MKIKTAELTGAALDWAVAEADGLRPFVRPKGIEVLFNGVPRRVPFSPSTDWSQGGPIIEREGIEINVRNWSPSPGCRLPGKYEWSARLCFVRQTEGKQFGPTPLIAAMRCYVASKLGEEVEIPEELL